MNFDLALAGGVRVWTKLGRRLVDGLTWWKVSGWFTTQPHHSASPFSPTIQPHHSAPPLIQAQGRARQARRGKDKGGRPRAALPCTALRLPCPALPLPWDYLGLSAIVLYVSWTPRVRKQDIECF